MVWLALLLTAIVGSYLLCVRAAKRQQPGWMLVWGLLPGSALLITAYALLAAVSQ